MISRFLILSVFCTFSHFSCFGEVPNDPRIHEVLTYWFGELQTAADYPRQKNKIWFGGSAAVDREIRERFEPLVIDAAKRELDAWKLTPRGRLALIILVDQFPRNIYRGTPNAFAFDNMARELTLEGLDTGHDLELFPIERAFFYLPLEHCEDMKIQELSVEKFDELAAHTAPSLASVFESYADYAWSHYRIIEKFGRFPHRNSILERESTAEELEFLKGPNSSF